MVSRIPLLRCRAPCRSRSNCYEPVFPLLRCSAPCRSRSNCYEPVFPLLRCSAPCRSRSNCYEPVFPLLRCSAPCRSRSNCYEPVFPLLRCSAPCRSRSNCYEPHGVGISRHKRRAESGTSNWYSLWSFWQLKAPLLGCCWTAGCDIWYAINHYRRRSVCLADSIRCAMTTSSVRTCQPTTSSSVRTCQPFIVSRSIPNSVPRRRCHVESIQSFLLSYCCACYSRSHTY